MPDTLYKKINLFVTFILFVFVIVQKDILLTNIKANYDIVMFSLYSLSIVIAFYFIILTFKNDKDQVMSNVMSFFNILTVPFLFITVNAKELTEIIEDPDKQKILLYAIITFVIFMLCHKCLNLGIHLVYSIIKNKHCFFFSEEERKQTLIHEVGHASMLVYANELSDASITIIKNRIPFSIIRGTLFTKFKDNYLYTKENLEWFMFMSLAGVISEKILSGKEMASSSVDYKNWKNMAELYLTSGFGGLYYPEAMNKTQLEINILTLDKLKKEQEAILITFMEKNKIVLKQFVENKFDKKIGKEEILDFLKTITKINEIPDMF